ncbi:MAG: sigma-54-dependent Fis family transcriptional regulator [Deferribacteres bacterium]|nr:sigma-54-dependent Fis family transcriptional regulator [candidate division KSB1 bacterium]MCB9500976.1 sigma-54-dependent Fis family transcriptional regulator [Deferribacteres bacterium]
MVILNNPFKVEGVRKIQNYIQSTTQFQCHYSECIDGNNSWQESDDKKLHFVWLNHQFCNSSNEDCREMLQRIHYSPTVAIVDGDLPRVQKMLIQKYCWNVISAPVSENAIMWNILKYLNGNEEPHQDTGFKKIKCRFNLSLLKGSSAKILQVKQKIALFAPHDVNIMIIGETGTGKELTARTLHSCGRRAKKAFIPVNCGAIPGDLFENELFGHRKGAYTHAGENENGLISAADGGTLFLDEVESLSPSAQVKLLRFLEEKKYKPLGQPGYKSADVTIIAAAKEDIGSLVENGKFRKDLYYRFSVAQIHLPPLREIKTDIPELARCFVERFQTLYQKEMNGITAAALQSIMHHDWPGNVRQLENFIHALVISNNSGWIELDDIQFDSLMQNANAQSEKSLPFQQAKQKCIAEFENAYLQNLLAAKKGNVSAAARTAQKERSAFCRLLKKYDINAEEYRL